MIEDLRRLPAGAALEADVCVIGGGAAGVTLGCELAGSGVEVLILESGGHELEAETQALSDGETAGVPYFAMDETRYRMLGGSTYRWGARGAPFQPIDFAERPWVERSGWPIPLDSLTPYYRRAERRIEMHVGLAYDGAVWEEFESRPPTLDDAELEWCAFQFGKALLYGKRYRAELEAAGNVRVLLHANATRLVAEGGRLREIEVQTLDGETFAARAERFVLAAGGIENPRLLLASGLANENDLVGRCFMEHPTATAGEIESDAPEAVLEIFSPGSVGGRLVETGWSAAPALQEREGCLNAVAAARPITGEDAAEALRRISWDVKHGRAPRELGARLGVLARDPAGAAGTVVRHLQGKPLKHRLEGLRLEIRGEQAPHPESRVTLSSQADRFGVPRPRLEWRMTGQDRETFAVLARAVARTLEREKLGRLRLAPWLERPGDSWPDDLVGGHHHMGATRMAASPADGVVDGDGRCHSIENLYIAGSSVFPTAGFVNPTPTIIALAIRLADHLAS